MKYAVKVPSLLSGFFAPFVASDFTIMGAVGGGIGLERGVYLEVSVEYSDRNSVSIENYINGVKVNGCIVRYIVSKLLLEKDVEGVRITVNQKIDVPIGGGYGSSAASALAIALTLSSILKLKKTVKQIAQIAHEADIVCRTGLGETVVGLLNPCGGIIIVKKPGGPYHAEVDHIPVDSSIMAVTAFYNSIPKNSIMASQSDVERIRRAGLETLNNIFASPSPDVFISKCYEFSVKSGLLTKWIENVIKGVTAIKGVLGASMNMIGEGVFMLVERSYIEDAINYIIKTRPKWIHIWSPMVCTEFSVVQVEQ